LAAGAWSTPAVPEFPADFLAAQLRAAAVKVTRPRLRVLGVLSRATAPLTHAELEERLVLSAEGGLDRVTLYRVLDSLVDCALARRTVDGRGVYRFLLSSVQAAHAAHAHFHCQRCGGVTCLEQMAAPVAAPVAALPAGFVARQVEIEVRGLCAGCSPTAGGAR
jgi:Fur family ferric uptake transcriptional regulator